MRWNNGNICSILHNIAYAKLGKISIASGRVFITLNVTSLNIPVSLTILDRLLADNSPSDGGWNNGNICYIGVHTANAKMGKILH